MNYRTISAIVIVLGLGLAIGCGQSQPASSKNPTVAVVDQVSIAKSLGIDQTLASLMQQANQQLSQQGETWLGAQKTSLQAEYDALGEDATDEQKAEFQTKLNTLNDQLRQVQQELQSKSDNIQNQLANSFRQEVLQAAQPIAEARGVTIVLNKTGAILWHASAIEITDEVTAVLRAKQAEAKANAPAATVPADAETVAPAIEGLDTPAPAPATDQ